MKKVISKLRNKLSAVAVGICAASAMAVAACAEGETTTASGLSGAANQITEQFTSAASDIIPIILGVLGAGLGIFVIFVGIKLAKKMFSTVSKG